MEQCRKVMYGEGYKLGKYPKKRQLLASPRRVKVKRRKVNKTKRKIVKKKSALKRKTKKSSAKRKNRKAIDIFSG